MERASSGRELGADLPAITGIARSSDQSVSLHAVQVAGEGRALDPQLLREVPLVVPAAAIDTAQDDPGGERSARPAQGVLEVLADRFAGEHDDSRKRFLV